MTKPARPQIVLTLEPLSAEVPVAVRVRQALKTLLRRDRLKCVKIEGDGLNDATAESEAGTEGRAAR